MTEEPANNLIMTFPNATSLSVPDATSVTFPFDGRLPFLLDGSGITVSFPAGSSIIIPEGHRISVTIPGKSQPFEMSSTSDGDIQVEIPGQRPISVRPFSQLGDVLPELNPAPLQLPAGSTIGMATDAQPILLPSPVTITVRGVPVKIEAPRIGTVS